PTAKRAFPTNPRQEHSCRFVKQSAQLAITTPRDVAVVVHFSRLEAPRCKPEPGTNRARPLEGIGLLERGDIGDGGDGPNRHERATGRGALHQSDDTTGSSRALAACHLSRLEKWHDHCSDLRIVRDQSANVLFENPTRSFFQNAADLVLKRERYAEQLTARAKQRLCQHGITALDPDLPIP